MIEVVFVCDQLNVFYLLLHIWFTLIYGFLFLLSTWIILCHCVSFVWWCVFSRVSSGLLYFYSSALGGSVLTVVLSVIKGWSP